VSFHMPTSGMARTILLVSALVILGIGMFGLVSLANEDPPAAVIFTAVMSLSSGLMFYLYRAMGQGQVSADSEGVRAEMGRLARAFIPLELVHTARRFGGLATGSWFGLNLGVHVGFGLGRSLDMVVGLGPGVELSLSRPCPARLLGVPLSVKTVRISLDEADFFVDYINSLMRKRL